MIDGEPRMGAARGRRRENARLLQGHAGFLGDLDLGPCLEAVIVRSPHARARISGVDAARARRAPGVVAVFAAPDLGSLMVDMPPKSSHPKLATAPRFPVAREVARYVGEPVAVVVAASRRAGEDAAALVEVSYEPLPAVASISAARAPGAPVVHGHLDSNVALQLTQRAGDPAGALAMAPHTLSETFVVRRGGGHSLEGRAVAARFDTASRQLTVWDATQAPHHVRTMLATLLEMHDDDVRVVAPRDIGGGFGPKAQFYGEEALVAWCARELGASVRWIEDRRENFLSATCERTQVHRATVGFDDDGTLLVLVDEIEHDLGAYPVGSQVPIITLTTLPGPYRIPNLELSLTSYYTNLPPTAPLRGSGRPQAVFVTERLIDLVARHVGTTPEAVRRRNLVGPDAQPYPMGLSGRDGSPVVYDSGNYPALLDEVVARLDVGGFRARQRAARERGCHLGLGLAVFVEGSGLGPFEGARARLSGDGQVVVAIGPSAQGQGHETVFAELAARVLDLPASAVEVRRGDTALIGSGHGAFASRVTATAGPALLLACDALRGDLVDAAAVLLEVPREKVRLHKGVLSAPGESERSVDLAELARLLVVGRHGTFLPPGMPVGLDRTVYFSPQQPCYTSGALGVVVEVDPELGTVEVLEAVLGHDAGVILNETLVEGQLMGGFAHGLGNALLEELPYRDDGTPLCTSYLDYVLPTALEVPRPVLFHHVNPSPVNPLGVKGAGEGGVIPVPAAVANAIEDALAPLGAAITETPCTPERVRAAIERACRPPATSAPVPGVAGPGVDPLALRP